MRYWGALRSRGHHATTAHVQEAKARDKGRLSKLAVKTVAAKTCHLRILDNSRTITPDNKASSRECSAVRSKGQPWAVRAPIKEVAR